MTAAPSPCARRLDLDWLRIIAFGLLILYHAGLLYVPWPYHAKSRHTLPGLVPLLEALNPWRLLLLFLISGVATRFMARKLPPARLLASRSARLLPPLLFGMLAVVPPQSFVQAVEQYGYAGDFLSFYRHVYLPGARDICNAAGCLAVPTWNHLWFVLYLFAYTLVLSSLLMLPWRRDGLALPLPACLLLPPLALIAARVLLYDAYPSNDAFLGDWYDHAIYGGTFLLGYAVAERERFWTWTQRLRWPSLGGVALLLPSVWTAGGVPLPAAVATAVLPPGLALPLYQWAAVLAACGFGARWLPRTDGPVRRTLTEAVFPFYIVHQTALVLCAHALRSWALPVGYEAATILGVTAASCFGAYWVARRIPLLRPVLGLRFHLDHRSRHARELDRDPGPPGRPA